MSVDEHVRRAIDTLTDRLRDEIARELRAVSDEVAAAVRLETETAVAAARMEAAEEAARTADVRVAEIVREAEKRIVEAETAAMDKVREADGRTALAETAALDQQRDLERRIADAEADAINRIAEAERRAADFERSAAQALQDADARVGEREAAARAKIAEAEHNAAARVAAAEGAASAKIAEAEHTAAERVAVAAGATSAKIAGAERDAAARIREVEEAARAKVDEAERAADARIAEVTAAGQAAHERQLAAFRTIDAARTLTGVLDATVDAAGREARTALLLVGRGSLRAWRSAGFDAEESLARNVVVSLSDAGIIDTSLQDRTTTVGDHTVAPRFAGLPQGRACAAVPVLLAGEPVAVVYADEGDASSPSPAAHWQDRVEAIARYGGRALEALTAFKAAGLMMRRGSGRAAFRDASRADAPAGPARDATTDEDEAARRYARLLVSEIKLYHEADVAAGQRERDLGTRLSAEIGRARVLYEQRVPAGLRLRTDYFQSELVRTLASGDATLLSAL